MAGAVQQHRAHQASEGLFRLGAVCFDAGEPDWPDQLISLGPAFRHSTVMTKREYHIRPPGKRLRSLR